MAILAISSASPSRRLLRESVRAAYFSSRPSICQNPNVVLKSGHCNITKSGKIFKTWFQAFFAKKMLFLHRMNRFSRIAGILMLSLYAFFFASTNLFIHTHEGPYSKIVHSHPWSGKSHSHSSSELQLINILSSGNCLAADICENPEPYAVCQGIVTESICVPPVLDEQYRTAGLRAPPVYNM